MQGLSKRFVAVAVSVVAIGSLIAVLVVWGPRQVTDGGSDDVWTCSMHPQVRLTKPGPCPICGMKLIPLSQLKSEQQRTERRASVETEAVTYRELFKEIRTVGKLDYNERRVKLITARIDGRVDRVYVDFTGIPVKAQNHLVDIYSPNLVSTQEELLLAARRERAQGALPSGVSSLTESARRRLLLWGVTEDQIDEIMRTGQARTHLTIYAPIGGVVIEKNVREQQYVKEGDMLYRIAELDPIWLYLDIYESDQAWIQYGQPVEVTLEAYPGETFRGTIVFIDPFLNDPTRTVKVRVNLKNSDRRLKPAMYASATIHVRLQPDGMPEPTGLEGKYICPMHPEVVKDEPGLCSLCEMKLDRVPARPAAPPGTNHAGHAEHAAESPAGSVLAVRASAVLDTGRRQIAYRKDKDGAFELVDVKLGPRAEARDERGQTVGYFPVISGLHPGDKVAIRGGFMLDSQQQIDGMPSLLYPQGQSAASLHAGHGGMPSAPSPPSAAPAPPGHKH